MSSHQPEAPTVPPSGPPTPAAAARTTKASEPTTLPATEAQTVPATAPTAPLTDIEKRLDRRNSIWVAIIAGLLGGLIAAGLGLVGTNWQINGQASQSQQEFLQDQRQIAYAQFAVDEQELRRSQDALINTMHPKEEMLSASTYQSLRDPIDDAYNKVLQDVSTIDLVGSDEAADIAGRIRDIHIERHEWVIEGWKAAQKDSISDIFDFGASVSKIQQGIGTSDEELTTMERQFVSVGRSDLGTG